MRFTTLIASRFPAKAVSRQIANYCKFSERPKLNIGCGANILPGWLNVDSAALPGALELDVNEAWPFSEGCFDAVLCEHMIEHIPKEAGIRLLKNVLKSLRPGAFLRVVTPDLQWIASKVLPCNQQTDVAYLTFLGELLGRNVSTWYDAINIVFYEYGHKYIWSIEELIKALDGAGFCNLTITRATQCGQSVFDGTEGHSKISGVELSILEAFAIEAQRPV